MDRAALTGSMLVLTWMLIGCSTGSGGPAPSASPSGTPAPMSRTSAGDDLAASAAPPAATTTPAGDASEAGASPGSAITTEASPAPSGSRDGRGANPDGPAASAPAAAPSSDRPAVGLPGGVPGAEPISERTVDALVAVASAENEIGGQAYDLSPAGEGWTVRVALWDGAREVRVGAAGAPASTRTVQIEDDTALVMAAAPVPLSEAAEVALARTPGDLDGVQLDPADGSWRVTVRTGSGATVVRVDTGTGTVVDEGG